MEREINQCICIIFYLDFVCHNKSAIHADFIGLDIDEYNEEKPVNYFDEETDEIKHKYMVTDEQSLNITGIQVSAAEIMSVCNMVIEFSQANKSLQADRKD